MSHIFVWQSVDRNSLQSDVMSRGGEVNEEHVYPFVCLCESREAPVWLTDSAKLLYSFQPSSGDNLHTKQLCPLLPLRTASRLFSESPARGRDGEGKWDLNHLRCHLALVYRPSLREGRGSTLEFSSHAHFTASHSERWLIEMQGRVNTINSCSAGCGARPHKTRQLNLKWRFLKSRPEGGHTAEQSFRINTYWLSVQSSHHHADASDYVTVDKKVSSCLLEIMFIFH